MSNSSSNKGKGKASDQGSKTGFNCGTLDENNARFQHPSDIPSVFDDFDRSKTYEEAFGEYVKSQAEGSPRDPEKRKLLSPTL